MLVTLTMLQPTGTRWFRIKLYDSEHLIKCIFGQVRKKITVKLRTTTIPNRKTTRTTFPCALSLQQVSAIYFHIFMAKRKKGLVTVTVLVCKYSLERKGKK